jgi:uncharacterized protein YidB (DUF937 family)
MSFLNDVIQSALRDYAIPQVGGSGSAPLADALRALLAPKSSAAGTPADASHLEPDALQQVIARFEQSGYADLVRSWIGTGGNEPIEPHQVGTALGARTIDDLAQRAGLQQDNLLGELARLLPVVIDRLTPQGRLPQAPAGR